MQYFLYFMAALWLVVGVGLLIIPELIRRVYIVKLGQIRNIKPLSVLPILFGVLFFLSADYLRVNTFGYAMGLMAIFKGLYFLILDKDKIKKVLDWSANSPVEFLRLWGAFVIFLGLILLSLLA